MTPTAGAHREWQKVSLCGRGGSGQNVGVASAAGRFVCLALLTNSNSALSMARHSSNVSLYRKPTVARFGTFRELTQTLGGWGEGNLNKICKGGDRKEHESNGEGNAFGHDQHKHCGGSR